MAYASDSMKCDPKRVGQVESARADLADTANRITEVVGRLAAQLEPVLSMSNPLVGSDGRPEPSAPLAASLASVNAQLTYSEEALRSLLGRLEI